MARLSPPERNAIMHPYPKRLIEVDLPIKRISAHSSREKKGNRHGHISTLHTWWARRPLAACRAVLCATLWPDPADERCPASFIEVAIAEIKTWAYPDRIGLRSAESQELLLKLFNGDQTLNSPLALRTALLDFVADFAAWDNSTQPAYLHFAQTLTQAAHEALGGVPGTRPLVVDPFAGGGSIPLEALRVGADAFASDLNPIPVLLNKVQLEYIPKYGHRLAEEVRKWGAWMKAEADRELSQYYPPLTAPTAALYAPQVPATYKRAGRQWQLRRVLTETPIAYLWARTVVCEGPGCGAEVPLMRSTYLFKKGAKSIGLRMIPNEEAKRVGFELINNIRASETDGTVIQGNATCRCCGFVTAVASVRRQLSLRDGGANDARLFAVVTTLRTERESADKIEIIEETGRYYRLPQEADLIAARLAAKALAIASENHSDKLSLVPDEKISLNELRRISLPIYGMTTWGSLFMARQAHLISCLEQIIQSVAKQDGFELEMSAAVQTCLALIVNRQASIQTSISRWDSSRESIKSIFARQAIGMLWDFVEANPFSGSSGDFEGSINWVADICERNANLSSVSGNAVQASATELPLPSDSVHAMVTDPPYYDAVPYAHLSDFFYVWLKRSLRDVHPHLFRSILTAKEQEIVVDRPHKLSTSNHDITFYEREMTRAFADNRRAVMPSGIGTIVFASKTAASWEAILQAAIDAGWVITASWPIDTEMETRVSAQGQARLASSVHIVCRPRERPDGSLITDSVGDWRDVLRELPRRIHEWMPRLAQEGVVGADAIFACLGPALEIFSQYARVEKPNGDVVTLREYLEQVWAAVSQEALNQLFAGTDTRGFEEDARLTAMWLWTLSAAQPAAPSADSDEDETDEEDDEARPASKKKLAGFVLDYDTARKISQGLGASLADLTGLVQVKGNEARLLPVAERAAALFGQDGLRAPEPVRRKRVSQLALTFEETADVAQEATPAYEQPELKITQIGRTVLDRLHQAMLLFQSGRTEALRRFLVEDGVGQDERFWKLAQALNALYPKDTQERRWVEAVQTYKKSLGL